MAVLTLKTKRGTYLGLNGGVGRFGAGDVIATGVTNVYDVDVSDYDCVTVAAALSAGALGDLGLSVQPLDSTGTAIPVSLTPAVTSPAQVLSNSKAYGIQQYDVRGIQAIQVSVKNNNAGSETVSFVDVFAAVTGVDF